MPLVMVPVSHISLPHFAAVYTHTVLTDGVHSAPPLVDGASDAAEPAEVPAVPPPAGSAGECSPPHPCFCAVHTHTVLTGEAVKKAKSTPRMGCGLHAISTDSKCSPLTLPRSVHSHCAYHRRTAAGRH